MAPLPTAFHVALPDVVEAAAAVLRGEPGLDGAWVFGSAAAGSMRSGSDIDLALRFAPGEHRARWEADPLDLAGRVALASGRDAHVVSLEDAPVSLRMQVLKHGCPLFDRAPARTRLLVERTLTQWFDGEHLRRVADEATSARLALSLARAGGGGG
jgi:predicted nucleotidyltransferase